MFDLTRQERQAVLFLLSVALLGIGIKFILKIQPPKKSNILFSENIGKVNLNKADKLTLKCIPGVGEKLAERIILYRAEHSGFSEIEELKNIKGITESKLEKMKNFLYLG